MKTLKHWYEQQVDLSEYLNVQYGQTEFEPIEIDQELYYDQLECVPPAFMSGGIFQVGEAYDSASNGKNRYFTYQSKNGKYYFLGVYTLASIPNKL